MDSSGTHIYTSSNPIKRRRYMPNYAKSNLFSQISDTLGVPVTDVHSNYVPMREWPRGGPSLPRGSDSSKKENGKDDDDNAATAATRPTPPRKVIRPAGSSNKQKSNSVLYALGKNLQRQYGSSSCFCGGGEDPSSVAMWTIIVVAIVLLFLSIAATCTCCYFVHKGNSK